MFTSPASIEGTYVCDGVLGDWLAPKHGSMREHPLTVRIERSRIADIRCDRKEIEKVRWILANGTGADRQLAVYRRHGDFKEVMDFVAEETAQGLGVAPAPARAGTA